MAQIPKSPKKDEVKGLLDINYKERLNFENIRKAVVFKPEDIKKQIIKKFNGLRIQKQIMVAYALKLSISGTNLERMVPIEYRGETYDGEKFKKIVEPARGADAKENEVTVNRYCAAFANEIAEYLKSHPDQVRMRVAGVEDMFSFPHCYYITKLTKEQREQCITWLHNHDENMLTMFSSWRPIATKAILYFKKNYDDA